MHFFDKKLNPYFNQFKIWPILFTVSFLVDVVIFFKKTLIQPRVLFCQILAGIFFFWNCGFFDKIYLIVFGRRYIWRHGWFGGLSHGWRDSVGWHAQHYRTQGRTWGCDQGTLRSFWYIHIASEIDSTLLWNYIASNRKISWCPAYQVSPIVVTWLAS